MKTLQSFIPKHFIKHNIAGAGLGAIMIDYIKGFCKYPESVTGYLRHTILFIKFDLREDKLSLLHKKNDFMSGIQDMLKKFGYIYSLKDIRIQ